MEIATEASNIASKQLLDRTKADVEKAEEKAAALNREIEKANEQNIQTINALDSKLDAIKLYPAPKPCRANPLPRSASSASPPRETDASSYAELFDRAIKEKARIADESANYAALCWRFVSSNCGIK